MGSPFLFPLPGRQRYHPFAPVPERSGMAHTELAPAKDAAHGTKNDRNDQEDQQNPEAEFQQEHQRTTPEDQQQDDDNDK